MSCDTVFADAECKAIYLVAHRKLRPEQPPSLDTMVGMIAILGGFLNRKWMTSRVQQCPGMAYNAFPMSFSHSTPGAASGRVLGNGMCHNAGPATMLDAYNASA